MNLKKIFITIIIPALLLFIFIACKNIFAEPQKLVQERPTFDVNSEYIGEFVYPCGRKIQLRAKIVPADNNQYVLSLKYMDGNSIADIQGKSENGRFVFAQTIDGDMWKAENQQEKIEGSSSGPKKGKFSLYPVSKASLDLIKNSAYRGYITYRCGRKVFVFGDIVSSSPDSWQLKLVIIDRKIPVITLYGSSPTGIFSTRESETGPWSATVENEKISGLWEKYRYPFVLDKLKPNEKNYAIYQKATAADADTKTNPRTCAP